MKHDLFDAVKRAEEILNELLPTDQPSSVFVGHIDATGEFVASHDDEGQLLPSFVSVHQLPPRPGEARTGERVLSGFVPAGTPKVDLVFTADVVPGVPVVLTIDGQRHSFGDSDGRSRVQIPIGLRWHVDMSVERGGEPVMGKLIVRRLPRIGAFRVDALPATILFAPPQTQALDARATYRIDELESQAITTTQVQESSETRPADLDDPSSLQGAVFNGLHAVARFGITLYGLINRAVPAELRVADTSEPTDEVTTSEIASKLNDLQRLVVGLRSSGVKEVFDMLGAIASGAELIGKLLGNASRHVTKGTASSIESGVSISTDLAVTLDTPLGSGPGVGDVVVYLRDIDFCWIYDPDWTPEDPGRAPATIVTMTGYGGLGAHPVAALLSDLAAIQEGTGQRGPRTGLGRESLQSLVALDPFVNGGDLVSAGDRFEPFLEIDSSGVDWTFAHVRSETDTQTNLTREFTSDITEMHSGFLAFMGLGVTEERTTTLKTELTRSVRQGVTKESAIEVKISVPEGVKRLNVYLDKILGGFAFVETVPLQRPWRPPRGVRLP